MVKRVALQDDLFDEVELLPIRRTKRDDLLELEKIAIEAGIEVAQIAKVLTPWYLRAWAGEPHRTGVYMTYTPKAAGMWDDGHPKWYPPKDGFTITQFRKYLGPNAWSGAYVTPEAAAKSTTSLQVPDGFCWRGLVLEFK